MRVYKNRAVGNAWQAYYIDDQDDSEIIIGSFSSTGKALYAIKKKKIENGDMDAEDIEVRDRNGNFKSKIDPDDVMDYVQGQKIPKDLPKLMRKLLKSDLSVRAMLTVLSNPHHPHYAKVLDVSVQLAISDKAKNVAISDARQPALRINLTQPEPKSLKDINEVFIDSDISTITNISNTPTAIIDNVVNTDDTIDQS